MKIRTRKLLTELMAVVTAVTLIPGAASASIIGVVTKDAETEAVQEIGDVTEAAETEGLTETNTTDVPEAESESEAETGSESGTAAETEPESESELPEEYKTELIFENDEVKITVTATEEAQLPMDTRLIAEKLAEDSEEYLSAKAAADEESGADPATTSYSFYNVKLVSDIREINPESGTVNVQVTFKNIRTDENSEQNVFHVEDTENGKVAEDVTDTAAAGDRVDSVDFEI